MRYRAQEATESVIAIRDESSVRGEGSVATDAVPVSDLERFFQESPSVLRSATPNVMCAGKDLRPVVFLGHYAPAVPRLEQLLAAWKVCASRAIKHVVILSPDHQRLVKTGFVTSDRGYRLQGRDIPLNANRAEELAPIGGATSTLFTHEHGVGVPLAMVARTFSSLPAVKPIVISSASTEDELVALLDLLHVWEQDGETLIVFSVDFSHYLPLKEAQQHDEATMRAFASRDASYMWKASDDAADFGRGLWLLMSLANDEDIKVHQQFSTVDLGGSPAYTTTFLAGLLTHR